MNQRVPLLIIGSLLLPLGCGGPTGPYPTLAFTTLSLPNGAPTVAYSETLVATGGDGTYTWSVTLGSLPTGLGLTTSTGEISGTPSAVASNTFTVQVTSGDAQTDTRRLTITVNAPPFCSDHPDNAIVTFEDATLEAAIRRSLSVGAQEPLTCGLVSGLTGLGPGFVQQQPSRITSLVGIENLTSLITLTLSRNSITDIGPLSGLTSLRNLHLTDNSITDIGPLSGLTGLRELFLDNNSISDISALSGLTSLARLFLSDNTISDISALSGLTLLFNLELGDNPGLSNIQPLLDNPGLGAGDTVELQSTNVRCTDVAALQAKGVTVRSDCP